MSSITRRDFARHAAALAGAAAIVPELLAQTSAPAVDPPATTAPAGAASAEAEARIAWIFGRHGHRLSNEQKADIRRLVTGAQPGLEDMRAYPLENSIEPATPFRIWRRDRNGAAAQRNLRPIDNHQGGPKR